MEVYMNIKEIIVEAGKGCVAVNAIIEAIPLCWKHGCDVVIIHNEDRYRVPIERIENFVFNISNNEKVII